VEEPFILIECALLAVRIERLDNEKSNRTLLHDGCWTLSTQITCRKAEVAPAVMLCDEVDVEDVLIVSLGGDIRNSNIRGSVNDRAW